MNCPKCDGEMWDNREKKKNPKAPDFKCKDKTCDGVIWPPRKSKNEYDQRRPEEHAENEQRSEYQKAKSAMQTPKHTPETLDARQKCIIRQHSQSMAIAVLQIKQAAGGLADDDLTPQKLTQLADYFDKDVLSHASHE